MATKRSLTISQVLPYIGEYGRFQRLLDVIFCLLNTPVAMQILIMNFATIIPTWTCHKNDTNCPFNGTLAGDDYRRCNVPRESWTYTEVKDFSLITQFDIHCEYEWILTLLSSIFFVGWGIGAIILGWIGDKYGRKILMFPSLTIIIIVGIVSSCLPNIYAIVFCRFIIGFFLHGTTTQGYILISEVVGSKQRPFACLIIFLQTSIAWIMLAVQSYLVNNWRILSVICTAPYIFIILFYKFVPESIQWLQSNDRTDEVMRILRRIAEWNNKVLPDDIIISTPPNKTSTDPSIPVDSFRSRKIIVQSLLLCYIWIVVAMSYYGLYMAANDLGGSLYRDFIILSLWDIPAIFISMYICNRFGRKACTLLPLLIGGIMCVAVSVTPYENRFKIIRVVLGCTGKFFLSIGFNGIYQWSVEIFPTNIRSEGMGLMTIAARTGSAAAPWIVKSLKPLGNWCPFVVMGVPAIFAFIVGLWLPETKENVSLDPNQCEINTEGEVAMETEN